MGFVLLSIKRVCANLPKGRSLRPEGRGAQKKKKKDEPARRKCVLQWEEGESNSSNKLTTRAIWGGGFKPWWQKPHNAKNQHAFMRKAGPPEWLGGKPNQESKVYPVSKRKIAFPQ